MASINRIRNRFYYNNTVLYIVFVAVYIAMIADISISNISDIVVNYSISFWGISLFVFIVIVFLICQFVLVNHHLTPKEIGLSIFQKFSIFKLIQYLQYVLGIISVIVVFQILFSSSYSTINLIIAVIVSYGIATFLMGILAFRLFRWFRISKSVVTIIFGIAVSLIAINSIVSLIYFDVVLYEKPSTIVTIYSKVIFDVGFNPGTFMSYIAMIQTYSMVGYFITSWLGTVFLLLHHIKRIGKIKFWILTSLPLLYFMHYYVDLFKLTNPNTPVTSAHPSDFILSILLYTYSIAVCGILIGIGYYSVSRSIERSKNLRNYLIFAAIGFVLYFNAADATVLQAPYPPYGLINVCLVGLSTFLIFAGLYNSALSVSRDISLRKLIKNSVQHEYKFLSSMGIAQMNEEMEKKVIDIVRKGSNDVLMNHIESSMSEIELKQYMSEIIEEVSKSDRNKRV